MSRYTANGTPWAIGKDVSDCATAAEVMEKAGLDFTVDKAPLMAKMPFGLYRNNDINEDNGDFARNGKIFRDLKGYYGTYRTDTNQPLGLVKDKYHVIQNQEAFKFFDNAIGDGKVMWDKAGCLNNGRLVYLSARLPITTKVGGDEIDNYLVFTNSHDGSTAVKIMFTPIRVICTNMLAGAVDKAQSYIPIRHTISADAKIDRSAEILRVAAIHANSAKQLFESLTKVSMSDADVMQYLANLQLTETERQALLAFDPVNGYKKLFIRDFATLEAAKISTRKANQLANMFEYYLDGIGQKHITGTAWGAYNAVTGFYTNVANLEGEKRLSSLLYGRANANINKALTAAIDVKVA